jgi:uncharacterized iron-regulated protein
MTQRTIAVSLLWLFAIVFGLPARSVGAADEGRCNLWIDLCQGEPSVYDEVLDDLAGVRVIYLGEYHTIQRHHELQQSILTDLAQRGKPLVLGLEQLESFQQSIVDRYNRGEINFSQLAEATQWSRRWSSYEQYRAIIEAAQKFKIPILALNAKSETIRQVARSGGIDRMDRKLRVELPAEMQLEDPVYRRLLTLQMMVHASANPERLRPMIEAQIARDEAMAATLCSFLKSDAGRGRSALVLCGAGHVAYGLGTASRVRKQLPQATDRIVLFSESGDLVLSPEEKAMARKITITHEQLREIDRPIADYLHVTSRKEGPASK